MQQVSHELNDVRFKFLTICNALNKRTQTKTNLIPQTKTVTRYVDALAPKPSAEPNVQPTPITGTVRPTAPLTPQQQRERGV